MRDYDDALAGLPRQGEAISAEHVGLADHLARLFDAEDVAAAWALHCSAMQRYGFDRVMYRVGQCHSDEQTLLMSSFPRRFTDRVLALGEQGQTAVSRWLRQNDGAISWRHTDAGSASAADRQMARLLREHGIVAGYSISLRRVSRRSCALIALCARPGLDQAGVDAIWSRHGRILMVLNTVLHLRVLQLPLARDLRELTPRQREVLEAIASGRSLQETAEQLGISRVTAEKHLRLARDALGAVSTSQAVLMATMRNQIFHLDGW